MLSQPNEKETKPEEEKKPRGKFGSLSDNQREFLRRFILQRFFLMTEDISDFYPFSQGEFDELRFGAFLMRRTSELQIVISSNMKGFSDVFSEKIKEENSKELLYIMNLPDE
ncbi:MAG: hypothetical protein ACOCUH_00360 [Bacteriovoracia bacterium]